MSDWNIEEGTVSFWVRRNKVKWNDGIITTFVNLTNNTGSVFVLKDTDNKLKFFHVIMGKGRNDVDFDVSNLDPNNDHMIAVTWSKKNKENQLFIDGKLVAKTKNEFAET